MRSRDEDRSVYAKYPAGVKPLRPRPWKAPRSKFRGKRKYFRKVARRAEAFRVDLNPPCWWDFWHYHADWPGWGNLGWRYRLEHLRALAVVFRRVLEASPSIPVPFQTYIFVYARDAGQDGVYIHSPNPNEPNFPLNVAAAMRSWELVNGDAAGNESATCIWADAALDETWAALLPGLRLRVARTSWPGKDEEGAPCVETAYYVYSPDAGVPLE
jgi:hypothetical protein